MIAKKIKAYLEDNGIKIKHVAEKLNMNYTTLFMKLNGDSKMTIEEYVAICNVLNISVDTFLITI